MKIGFITTHQYKNFGTFLQCYALQYTLTKLGHHVEVVDYQRKEYQKKWIEKTRIILGDIRRYPLKNLRIILNYPFLMKRICLFNKFYKRNFQLSSQKYPTSDSLKKNPPIYDLYISGSDQIWNPTLNGFIEPYFLTFVPKGRIKAAYAPSIGIAKLNEKQQDTFKRLLHDFKFISCREKSGVQLLNNCGIINVTQVIDPTLLVDKEYWLSLSQKSSINKQQYGLTYFLSKTDYKEKLINPLFKTKRRLDLTMETDCNYKSILAAGPYEFLSLINNADFICTDSFHGVVFSILFEKEFYALPRHNEGNINSQNSRITDFLKDLGLSDRWIQHQENIIRTPINYHEINTKLSYMKEKSFNYIKTMLHD